MPKNLLIILVFFVLIIISGCVDDNVAPLFEGQLNPAAELLVYFESNGDFINSIKAPALADAEEVYANLTNYLLIDIRNTDDFTGGHIQGAINMGFDSLFSFLKSIDAKSFPKIILISKNGQSSSYFTCLLRLAGFDNIFSLKYGMASWNQVFSGEWLNALKDANNINDFTNDDFPKNNLTDLPDIVFDNPEAPLSARVQKRVEKIISEGFYSAPDLQTNSDHYIVCYGKMRLYYARRFFTLEGRGHAPGAVSYLDSPNFELMSGKYLQSMPKDKPIYIYDYDGHLSACIAAYLRMLGYQTYTLLFGANQLFYSRITAEPELFEYAFSENKIYNFPYVSDE